MRLALVIVGILLSSTVAHSATIYVPDDYPTIQGAIVAAVTGDTIVVRPGTYVESIDYIGKDVAVISEKGPAITVIDGNGLRVVNIQLSEGPGAILEGFTITNGDGGVYVSGTSCSPFIRNNIITGNSTSWGGGIYCKSDCRPTIVNNVISNNSASWGGGIYNAGSGVSPLISGNIIIDNSGGYGGGIANNNSGSPTIVNNIIAGNTATYGSGIFCEYTDCLIGNNTIANNSSTSSGGGVYVHKDSWPTIANTILWNNAAPTGPEIAIPLTSGKPATCDVDYCDVKGGQGSVFVDPSCTLNWGPGMIDADPLFADAANDDFHLTWNSPCRDVGDSSSATEPADFEGDLRIALGVVDMGGDEYYFHLYHAGAVIPGSNIDLKTVGGPGMPVLLALGSGIQDPPQWTQYGDLWLNQPPLWYGIIGTVPGNGLLVLSTAVPAGWAFASEHPLQALVGPWNGPWTRLTNADVLIVE